jgi:hypothetical protein
MKIAITSGVTAAVGLLLVSLGTVGARADNIGDFDSGTFTNCTTALCGAGSLTGNNFGTVKVTDISNGISNGKDTEELQYTVTLGSDSFGQLHFLGPNATNAPNNIHGTFGYGLNVTSASVSGLPANYLTAGNNVSMDGMGSFKSAVEYTRSNQDGTSITFDVTVSGLSSYNLLSDIVANTSGFYFAAFVTDGSGSSTCPPQGGGGDDPCGVIGVKNIIIDPVPGPIIGAGLPGLVAACMGLVAFARRRLNKLA